MQYGEWLRAKCIPSALKNAAVVCHYAAIQLKPAKKFVFSSRLSELERDTFRAVRRCCKAERSQWTMRQALTAAECRAEETWLGSVGDVWKLAQRLRSVKTYRGEVGQPCVCIGARVDE